MVDIIDDVRKFCQKFGRPHHPQVVPHFLSDKEQNYWLQFIIEELSEYLTAVKQDNLANAGDAICDLIYVIIHMGHNMGLPLEEMWDEVQRANMAKERSTGDNDPRSTRHSAMDVVKPEGWTPPDHWPSINRTIHEWCLKERERQRLLNEIRT